MKNQLTEYMPILTATEFSSVKDKEKFFNHFIRFVNSGFKETIFPKWFYNRLSNCFGNIAHYNKAQFYQVQFSDAEAQCKFLNNCLNYPCYGSPEFTYSDVERCLIIWIQENKENLFNVIYKGDK